MKPKSSLRSYLAAIAGSALLAISYTHAATFYWDGNDTTGNADGGAGNWDNLLTNWDTLAAGGSSTAWTAGGIAVFSLGGNPGYTATLTDNITVGGLVFNKVNGSGATNYTIDAAANTLSFSSGDNTLLFNNGNGGVPSATITGQLAGSGANVIVSAQSSVAAGGQFPVGTLTLNGTSTGGWSGTTTINHSMTLSLAAANRGLASTSGITLNSGAIVSTNVDATQAAYDRFNDSAGITINGGGTFTYTNTKASGRIFAETLGAVTLNSGQFNAVLTSDQNSGGGNVQTLTLGSAGNNVSGSGLARTTSTSAVTFSAGTTGPNATTNRISVYGAGTTSGWVNADPSNSIIGAWATTGTTAALQNDYAVYNGGYVVAANTTATAETSWSDAAKQYTLSYATKTATALTATRNIAALKASTTIASVSTAVLSGTSTFTVASGHSFAVNDPVVIGTPPGGFVPGQVYYVQSVGGLGTTFTLSATPGGAAINATSNVTATFAGGIKLDSGINLGTTGILNSGTSPIGIGRTAAGGQISLPTAGAGNLFINAGSGSIGIDAPIVNNGGALTVVKTGSSILHLSNNNTFTGGLVVNAGTLRLSGTQSFTGGVTLSGGAFGDSTDGISAAELGSNSVTVNGNASMFITSGETLASAVAISSTGNLKLNGPAATLSGVVSGSGVLTLTGSSGPTVTLSNTANTHTGVITITNDNNQNATLAVNSLADSASPGAGNIQMGGGAAGGGYFFALHSGAIAPLILNNRQVELVGDGYGAVMPLKLSNNSSQALTINSNLLASGTNVKTLTLGGSGAGLSTFAGTITNGSHTTLNLTKADNNNTWVISNTANSYNGATTINGGTLRITSIGSVNGGSSALGNPSSVANGRILMGSGNDTGTLEYTGALGSSDREIQINSSVNTNTGGATILNNGSGALTFSATNFNAAYVNANAVTRVLTLGGSNGGDIAGIIQNNSATNLVGLTKTGSGTWELSGTNSYTGITTLGAGKLVLDYGVGGTNTSKLSDTVSALVLGVAGSVAPSTLELKGGSHAEEVTSTTLTAGTSTYVTQTGGGTSILRMNGITFGAGSAIDFAAASIASTSTANNASGILSNGATINGTDWATNSGTLEGSGNNFITAYTAYNDVARFGTPGVGIRTIADGSTTNVRLTEGSGAPGTITLGAVTTSINTLNQSISGGTSAVTIDLPSRTLRTSGILMGPTAGALTIGATGGTTALSGTLTPLSNGSLTFTNNSTNDMVINSVLAANGTNTYTKVGTGTLILAGDSTFTVGLTIQDGTVKAGKNSTSGTVGPFGNGGTVTLANKSTAALDLNTFDVTVNALNGGGTLGGNVILGSKTLTIGNVGGSYDGIISGTNGNIRFGGSNTMTFTGANTYTGTTTLTGTMGLFVSNLANGGTASNIGASTSDAANLVFNGSGANASVRYNGTAAASSNRQFTLQTSGGFGVYSTGALNLTSTAAIAHGAGAAAPKTLLLAGNGAGGGTLAAQITDSGTGANITGIQLGFSNSGNSGANWSLTNTGNTFTGAIVHTSTNYAGGTFSYASAGGSNAITFNQTVSPGTGGVSYIGSTDKTMTGAITANALSTGTITLDSSGTGAVNYSNSGSLGNGGASGAKGLVLSGTNTGNNILAGQWVNNTAGGSATLTKNGAGTWSLTNSHTYSGATTINAGTLTITGATLDTTAITVGVSGKLGFDIASPTVTASAATVTLGGSVQVTGTPTLASYTLLTASSITGTPVLATPIPGYTLVIDGGNTLKLNSTGGPVGFAAWQSANSTAGARGDDHDNDGVDNGTEHFLGGTANTTGFTALPGVINTLGVLSVTWTKAGTYTGTYPTDYVVETSATLAAPWAVIATSGSPSVANTVHISGNNVTYTFPAGTKNFARLKVTGP